MNANLAEIGGRAAHLRPTASSVPNPMLPDPLDPDDPMDEAIVTTRRGIARVALVAAETAGRFQRQALKYDPMAWMMSPRTMFDGAAAIDACLDRDECLRGILVHGLGFGLDMDRADVDDLLAGDEYPEHGPDESHDGPLGDDERDGRGRASRLRLYTATIADARNGVITQVFHASVAREMAEVRARLVGRFGPDLADAADIRLGIHASAPLVVALVPDPVVNLIRQMQIDCKPSTAGNFSVDIQHSIHP